MKKDSLTTIRTEGALLPPDVLQRIADGDTSLGGLTAESYHLSGQKINEAINQSWNTIQGAWANFKTAQERLPTGDIGTTITRERWLLPLFRELEYGRLQAAAATDFVIDDKNYPVSHKTPEGAPIHLVSYQVDLDRRAPGVTGASTASPHGLVQVLLNRSEAHLWGFVSNGFKMRILRDNASLTRQAYVEFDLQAMMDGEVYSDFALLWLLCHQSRIENGRDCWLEQWAKAAREQGTRALDDLRIGVEAAITALGLGFLDHPANIALRDKLESGALDKQDYYRQLLRLVYRLLFLFAAEDRGLLYDPAAPEAARQLYTQHYSTARLRRIAEKLKGTRHHDLFEAFRLVMEILGGEDSPSLRSGEGAGGRGLGLPVLGSFLFTDGAVADIITAKIANVHLLDAVRALAFREDKTVRKLRPVDYKNLGAEELGSVYESLLELHPQINVSAKTFSLGTAGGNERKTTGSYYTPTSLINALLDSALDPVILEAITKPQPESALLDLKICDPACGSGHFLIAAAHRVARALAQVRTGEEEPAPAATRAALRDVIGHCIYGVDINPMAVELCKVNLWMEALEPGKPLSFLDHRIQVGNSLLGTTPALMANGIPDDAFNPIEGDDKADAARLKKLNRQERKDRETGQRSLFELVEPPADYRAIAAAAHRLDTLPDDTLAALRAKEQAYADLAGDPERQKAQILADAWCAAFVWDKSPESFSPRPEGEGQGVRVSPPMTDLLYRRLQDDALADNLRPTREYVSELAQRYQFFHWHVAFPDVFHVDTRQLIGSDGAGQGLTGWDGGFDCVLGNPPWDMIQIDPNEYFSVIAPEIATTKRTSEREKLIQQLKNTDPRMYNDYFAEIRYLAGVRNLINQSHVFPLTSYGRLNIASTFAELFRIIINPMGFAGLIIPTGIATDSFNQYFFSDLVSRHSIASLFDFENAVGLFPGIGHGRFKFCLLTLTGNQLPVEEAEFGFFFHRVDDLRDSDRRFKLSLTDFVLFNPNTKTCPIFRSKRDMELTRQIYEVSQVLINETTNENLWNISLNLMFMMNTDSHLFKTLEEIDVADEVENNVFAKEADTYLPLYEAKLMYYFDHRYGDYRDYPKDAQTTTLPSVPLERLRNPFYTIHSRFWVEKKEVLTRLSTWGRQWLFTYRAISNSTNERTFISGIQPVFGLGNSLALVQFEDIASDLISALLANFCSLIFDWVVRQKMGGTNVNMFYVKQFPVIPPHTYTAELLDFIVPRILELTYTAWDLQPFAQDVGYAGTPFIWDDDRRFLLRCELDALYFHLYSINRDDAAYILDTFPIVKRKDEAAHGEYRTARVILEMFDQMAALPVMHVPAPKGEGEYPVPDVSQWATWLNPPPASPAVAHPVDTGS